MTNAGIFSIIIRKLSYWKESWTIILLKIYKNLKISFYNAVFFFCLAIGLGVKNGRKFPLNV